MVNRTTLADALHQAGRLPEAETALRKAEEMQKELQPYYPLLYSLPGFRYYDLLLTRGKYRDVLNRAEIIINIGIKDQVLLEIALGNLSLGRILLFQALNEGTGDFTQAAEHLNNAVVGLRRAGRQDILPRSLLARAELHIAQNDFEKARRDLDEAMTIAQRGEMGLHKADCRLGYARLFLATGEKEKAREELAIAEEMIGKMGYHRRDGEVKEMEERLKL
jgi:tetratricopeptide (TPR) repeat protein